MKIIAVVGRSGSGKTRLIARLIPELKRRGLSVAVVKHCGGGFDFGGEDKDSSKFLAAGAAGVALAGPGLTAVLRPVDRALQDLGREEFGAADILLVEGGKNEPGLSKIEVLRAGVSNELATSKTELEAVVADGPVACDVPVFHPEGVLDLANWLVRDVAITASAPPAAGAPGSARESTSTAKARPLTHD